MYLLNLKINYKLGNYESGKFDYLNFQPNHVKLRFLILSFSANVNLVSAVLVEII